MAKIMLVEDDNNLREIYEARLQAEGYTIATAKDGEEALVVAKAEKPDLIISDVMMPKISGFEMLDILRNTDGLQDVKVIMLTALGQSDDQQRAERLGSDRYLVKSQVTLEDIINAAHELLEDKQAEEAVPEATNQPEPAAPPAVNTAVPDNTNMPPAAEPATEALEPAPVPEPAAPVSEPVSSSSIADTASQPVNQEEAAVEAKIEDFVAGATEEATTPEGEDLTPPVPPVEAAQPAPIPDPVATPPADSNTTDNTAPDTSATVADDQLMSDAIQTLATSAGTTTDNPTPAVAANDETTAVAPTENPVQSVPPATLAAEPATDNAGSVPIAGKKVITPIDNGTPKKDINELLAEEEAKQAGGQIPPQSPTSSDDNPNNEKVDPNNIAL